MRKFYTGILLLFGDGYLAEIINSKEDGEKYILTLKPSIPLVKKYKIKLDINGFVKIKLDKKYIKPFENKMIFLSRKNYLGEETLLKWN